MRRTLRGAFDIQRLKSNENAPRMYGELCKVMLCVLDRNLNNTYLARIFLGRTPFLKEFFFKKLQARACFKPHSVFSVKKRRGETGSHLFCVKTEKRKRGLFAYRLAFESYLMSSFM